MTPWTPFSDRKKNTKTKDGSVDTGSENGIFLREKHGPFANLWRPRSLVNIVNPTRRPNSVLDSKPDAAKNETETKINSETAIVPSNDDKFNVDIYKKPEPPVKKLSGGWRTVVTIVLVEAKGLPDPPTDGSLHGLYCKIRCGSQTLKSKTVQQPEWLEQFQFYILKDQQMQMSLWDKGKVKTFMGSSVLDLSSFEWGRTHEVWQQLDNGYGSLHLSVTICNTRKVDDDRIREAQIQNIHATLSSSTDWKLVGQLYVKVVSGKGLSGRFSAYCTLEVDNEKVRTHSVRGAEPAWDKSFVFNVYDATTTLDLKAYESSLMMTLHNESLGRISIPLLRIRNGETKWYALKDKSKRTIARTTCPRVLLEMSFFYNPIKASLRVFQPKEVKYMKKPQKFDVALVYKNMEFVRDTFILLYNINESYKRLFEWENQELSFIALSSWLIFWYNFKPWTAPLFLLIPFFYFWIYSRNHSEKSFMRGYGIIDALDKDSDKMKTEKGLATRLQELPDMTLTITNGIDYMASLTEKLYNLASFKVPFLSYLTMLLLVAASAGLYFIPFNFIMMFLGIYKFTRKYLKPDRTLNNDLEDFLTRIPDTEILGEGDGAENLPHTISIDAMAIECSATAPNCIIKAPSQTTERLERTPCSRAITGD